MSDFGIIDKRDLVKMTGIPASVGVCEPIEGFAERPDLILGCMKEMADKLTAARDEAERLGAQVGEFAAFVQGVAERQFDPDFVMPGVESDMKLLLEQSRAITQEDEACDYESPWLLRKQAEAVERLASHCSIKSMGGNYIWKEAAIEEATRLRQQADEAVIRDRYRIGAAADEVMSRHSWEAIAEDYDMHVTSLRRIMRGDFPNSTRLSEDDKVQVWQRRELFWQAHAERSEHGVDALKRDYRMSTDTLNKIIDATANSSSVTEFLTGRFDVQVSRGR